MSEYLDQNDFNHLTTIQDEVQPYWQEPAPVKKPAPKQKILFVAGGISLVIIILFLVILLVSKKKAEPSSSVTPTAAPISKIPNSAAGQQLEELQTQLEAADPTKKELLFPQVDLEIKVAE